MENTTDPEEWRQEVERVLPSLKVHYRSDNRDWRMHYEQMHNYHDNIKTVLSDTKVHLSHVHVHTYTLPSMYSLTRFIWINCTLRLLKLLKRLAQEKSISINR